MYNSCGNRKFKKQESDIIYHTVILCQSVEEIPMASQWLKEQRDIPYLPKSDMFAYYCPMCNRILSVGVRCRGCNQLIEWVEDMSKKLVSDEGEERECIKV